MTSNYIEFKKQRDFGSMLTAVFGFIRNEFKPFMIAIFQVAGPAILLYLASMALYTYTVGDAFNFDIYSNSPGITAFGGGVMIISAIAYAITAITAYILTEATALFYIKSYVDNKGVVDMTEVKRNVYSSFWGFLGLGILKGITLGFAFILCFLPIFYAMVPMVIVFSIYVFERRRGATDSYSHSFYLVNEDFWLSLGTIIVIGLIFYALTMVFTVPTLIYTYAKMGIFSGEIDPTNMDSLIDPIYIFLQVLSSLFQLLLGLIITIAGAVIYFHLNEKRNFTGTYEEISNIGGHIEN